MIDPALIVRLSIQCGRLYIDVRVRRVEVDVLDRRSFASKRTRDVHRLEVRGNDQVNVLSGIGKQPNHRKCKEGSHGSTIVIARKTIASRAKELWNIKVRSNCAQRRSACVVVLEYRKEGWLIAYVCNALIVEEVQALDEVIGTTIE